jgi:protein SCO1/2
MNDRATTERPCPRRAGRIATLFLLAAAIPVAACQRAESEQGPLTGSSVGGPFSLIDQDGKRVRDTDFNGRYRLIYFGFANCPDVCPVDLQVMGAGLKQLEKRDAERARRIQPIFITVDPERDTPEVLKRYVANFHPRLIGLTGSMPEVEAAKKEFATWSEKGEAQPGGGYNVNHMRIIYLMDPAGAPVAIVPHDQGPEGVVTELDRWVR